MRPAVLALLACSLVACGDTKDEGSSPDGSSLLPPATSGQQPAGPSTPGSQSTEPAKPPLEVLTEVVYVLMKGWDGNDWMCTGALVAKDTVLTAGHCLDDSLFESWEVMAPLVKDKPRTSVAYRATLGAGHEPAQPDIGLLKLDHAIELPVYAQITDISERVKRNEALTGVTIVRTDEEPEAPFKSVGDLAISSTTQFGYANGIAVPIFSQGGDSGAGLFLVENGHTTHKLVGIARNPEQKRKIDHFTLVAGGEFKEWFDDNSRSE